jgi:cytochrome c-type biogenesis protein CcsB
MVYNGSLFKVLPVEKDPDSHWESLLDMHQYVKNENATLGISLFTQYMEKLNASITSGNYNEADVALQNLIEFQRKGGAALIPSQTKIDLEVFYNDTNIFKTLFPVFMLLGMILFGFFFVQIFKLALEFKIVIKILIGILVLAFAAQTFGLGLRWYIAGHAPWSNGYESMIYIAWATMLAGFVFMKKSPIILSVTALVTGVTLLTAHMSWMNPEITNLVPVLKSYWLTIHVATITASYGFLALGGMTGFLNLCIMIFRNKDNVERVNLTLKELTLIIELSFSVGLVLLVIGNFLGGIWANESWGRYWGWDPKETWSLVTIIVYSFILHMRLIPGLRSTFSFNFMSMFGFSSVLMTYFGVNYYLSGLHSYASGDPVPVPTFVYYTLAVMILISILAAYNDYKTKDQSPVLEEE